MVMTLILLALAATLLAGTASHSMRSASEAMQTHRDLQRRWAAISARRTLLDRAGELFSELDTQTNEFDQRSDFTVITKLGEFDLEVLVADEDAKLNLNSVYRNTETGKVAVIAERFAFKNENPGVEVRLLPQLGAQDNDSLSAFETWQQVFRHADGGIASPVALKRATRRITCWGSGRVSVARASDDVLREACNCVTASVVGNRLVQERRRLAEPTLAALLEEVELRPEQRAAMSRILSDQSSCYSAWIMTRSGKRSWTELHIVGASGSSPNAAFVW